MVELLVVIAIIAVLAAMLLPALHKAKLKAQGIQCMNNHKHLAMAWRMYADDSNDVLTYASISGQANNWPDAYAWSGAQMNFSAANRAAWSPDADMVKRPLWPYVGRAASVFKCPADRSTILVNNVSKPRTLTMSMNVYVGGFAPIIGVDTPPYGTDGHWPFAQPYNVYPKLSALVSPKGPPDKIFVFLDMREDSVNWSNFMTDMTGDINGPAPDIAKYQFTSDLPGFYHHRAAGFSFADGHCELHRWLDQRTMPPIQPGGTTTPFGSPGNVDIAWLQEHSTRVK